MIPINIISENIQATYTVFKNFIIDRNFEISNNKISWPGYKSGISKQLYSRQYEDIISNRQFTFLLTNDDAIQIFYQYDGNGLKKVRLAYYPSPKLVNVEYETLDMYYDEALNEALESQYMLLHDLHGQGVSMSNTTNVRLDFDREVTTHCQNHMQIDGIQELRIPFYHLITPFHFMDFILQNIFTNDYLAVKSTQAFVHLNSTSKGQIVSYANQKNDLSIHININN